jgi:hypothetical protein
MFPPPSPLPHPLQGGGCGVRGWHPDRGEQERAAGHPLRGQPLAHALGQRAAAHRLTRGRAARRGGVGCVDAVSPGSVRLRPERFFILS